MTGEFSVSPELNSLPSQRIETLPSLILSLLCGLLLVQSAHEKDTAIDVVIANTSPFVPSWKSVSQWESWSMFHSLYVIAVFFDSGSFCVPLVEISKSPSAKCVKDYNHIFQERFLRWLFLEKSFIPFFRITRETVIFLGNLHLKKFHIYM